MSDFDGLPLPADIIFKLQKRYENIEEVLLRSAAELKTQLSVDFEGAKRILKVCSYEVLRVKGRTEEEEESGKVKRMKLRDSTALQGWKNAGHAGFRRRLSTGDSVINEFLQGGILSKGITEIVGESATAKTQICLQLCLTVQLPLEFGGLDGAAAFVSTEDSFPIKRLNQMIPHFKAKFDCVADDVGSQIFSLHTATLDQLDLVIHSQLPNLLANSRVRLVVIDSFAAIFRTEFTAGMTAERSKHLATYGSKLKALSDEYDCAIVCINQVSDNFSTSSSSSQPPSSLRHGANVVPALGLAWANTINVRLMLSRWNLPKALQIYGDGGYQDPEAGIDREMEVVFAPHLPPSRCKFRVTEEGVSGVGAD